MSRINFRHFLQAALISIAIYPIVMIGVWLFVALGVVATDQHLPTDTMPLIYGLIFAALTLALIEAVTGTVPFVADTTLGTLMARVDRELVVPDELGPLKPVLEGAGHFDPEQRTDARTLATGLLIEVRQLAAIMPTMAVLAAPAACPARSVSLGSC